AVQIPMVHAACEALGVPILNSERYEADDVIGTLATKATAAGFDVAIVTMDKDFFQLVRDGIRVFNPRDEGTWYDAAGVQEKFGVAPGQVVDVLALMGDTIDNIKGVPGIGEKGARELITTYGSLDNLLAHAGEIPQKRYREALVANVDAARQSRELADGGSAMTAAIVGLAFSVAAREGDYVPVGHRALGAAGSMPLDAALEGLRAILENPAIRKVGHDLKFDTVLLARHGVRLSG